MPQVVVIGGGAAGFFAAIRAAELGAQVLLLEKTGKTLAKVRISGGGRCNLTHNCADPATLATHYPRGGAELLPAFARFGQPETLAWFAARGVRAVAEADGRMFPHTNQAETVATCLEQAARQAGVSLRLSTGVSALEPRPGGGYTVQTTAGPLEADRVIVATGGAPKAEGMAWLARLGLEVVPPVPSLFTFNLPGSGPLQALAGVSVPAGEVALPQLKDARRGPLLVTHWGLSGPGVLRLSAWQARALAEAGYQTPVLVNWLGQKPASVLKMLKTLREANPKKRLANLPVPGLPRRLQDYTLQASQLPETLTTSEAGNRHLEQWAQALCQDKHLLQGKTTYKDEFVTAGGIALHQVDFATMEARSLPGLHLCGEVLDVDAITGGFNFQAAWTTGWLAGTAAAQV